MGVPGKMSSWRRWKWAGGWASTRCARALGGWCCRTRWGLALGEAALGAGERTRRSDTSARRPSGAIRVAILGRSTVASRQALVVQGQRRVVRRLGGRVEAGPAWVCERTASRTQEQGRALNQNGGDGEGQLGRGSNRPSRRALGTTRSNSPPPVDMSPTLGPPGFGCFTCPPDHHCILLQPVWYLHSHSFASW